MKFLNRRRKVAEAEAQLRLERERWHRKTTALRARLAGTREWLIVGTGVSAGLITGLLPLRGFARVGSLIATTASFALRSPIGAMLIKGAVQRSAAADAADTAKSDS